MQVNKQIRKCTSSDLEALLLISRETFVLAFEKDNNPVNFKAYIDVAFSRNIIAQQLNNPNSGFYFLFVECQLVGYFKLNQKQAQSEKMDNTTMELERIYVRLAVHGQGFGTFMLKEAIRIASVQKNTELRLGVWQENTDAVRFYEKFGFKKFGTHPFYIGSDKQTDWLMKVGLY